MVIQQKPRGMSKAINELQLLNSAQTGTIGVTLNMIGHSHDCDCDLQTWDCSKGPFSSILGFFDPLPLSMSNLHNLSRTPVHN